MSRHSGKQEKCKVARDLNSQAKNHKQLENLGLRSADTQGETWKSLRRGGRSVRLKSLPSGQGRDRQGRSGAGVWELPSGQVDKIIRSAGYQESGLRRVLYRTESL